MLPQPRTTTRTKRSSKRLSAPPKSLENDIKVIQPVMQTAKSQEINKKNDDSILDLLGFDTNDSNTNTNTNTNANVNGNGNYNNNNKNETDDIFDMFSSDNNNNNNNNRNTVNTLQIHPNLMNPRESKSLQPDKLFDVAMWQNFDDETKKNSQQQQQPRNTTLSFEPINIQKRPPTIKEDDDNDDDDEEEEDDEEDDDEDIDDEEKAEKEKQSNSKKMRATAPPTTSLTKKQKNGKKDSDDKKETNALEELHRGAALLKYPRRSGFPHFKHIQLSSDNLRIQWFSKRKNLSTTCIWIKDIREVVRGQETEVFKKFHQKTLEKSSFSIVYGHSYKTLDVAAKSIDECEMWVKCISKLCEIYKQHKKESDLRKLNEIFVGITFKDRNRPMSRQGSGHFIRANSSKNLKIDPVALKEIERDMENLHKTYHKTAGLAQKAQITKSNEYSNIQYVLSELEERIEELTYEVANIRDTELAKREVWRANVDLTAIQEKVEVLLKHSGSDSRRKSNFL